MSAADGNALRERYPFLFDGLSEWEVAARLEYLTFRFQDGKTALEGVDRLVADTSSRREPETLVYNDSVEMLLLLLREVCKRARCESVADEAEELVRNRFDAARRGNTYGEQRASIVFRYPGAMGSPESIKLVPRDSELRSREQELSVKLEGRAVRGGKKLFGLLPALELLHQFDQIRREIESLLPRTKAGRRALSRKAIETIRDRFPELKVPAPIPKNGGAMKNSLEAFPPEVAARAVLAARLQPRVSPERVEAMLTQARRTRALAVHLQCAPEP